VSSLRFQKMNSRGQFNKLHREILASSIGFAAKTDLLRELEQHGLKHTSEIRKKFDQIVREKLQERCHSGND